MADNGAAGTNISSPPIADIEAANKRSMDLHKQLRTHLDNTQTHLDNATNIMNTIESHIKGLSAQQGGGKGGMAGELRSSGYNKDSTSPLGGKAQ